MSASMLWNALSRRMPALLTTMSMRPNASIAVCTIASPSSGVPTELRVGDRLAAGGLDLLDDLLGRRRAAAGAVDRAAEVVHHDERAALGEQQRMLPAEATTGAGDDRHLAVEPEIRHERSVHFRDPRSAVATLAVPARRRMSRRLEGKRSRHGSSTARSRHHRRADQGEAEARLFVRGRRAGRDRRRPRRSGRSGRRRTSATTRASCTST